MITKVGKNIIAKYLIGNAPAYASYIALGCGATPRTNVDTLFNVSSSGAVLTLEEGAASDVWVGAKILVTGGTGQLSSLQDTIVTAILTNETISVSPEPVVPLSGATVFLQTDPNKKSLDFEMFRIPITSRGYINDDGVNKIVLTASLPSEERYEITEVGVYSSGANSSAGAFDSKILYSFSQDEGWEYHNELAAIQIPTVYEPLDPGANNIIDQPFPVFQTNADNRIFSSINRLERYERPRFLNNSILIAGNDASLTNTVQISNAIGTGTSVTYTTTGPHLLTVGDVITIGGIDPIAYNLEDVTVATVPSATTFTVSSSASGFYVSGGTFEGQRLFVGPGSNHIHLTGATVDLNRNAPTDQMKFALSLVNKNGLSSTQPDRANIILEFASSDVTNSGEFARFEVILENGVGEGKYNFQENRHFVVVKELQELYKSIGFTWSIVNVVKIYATVLRDGLPTDDYYVALDGVRLDNISTPNPLYGMVGYSVIQNPSAETIIKRPNTSNYIEFRYSLDVI